MGLRRKTTVIPETKSPLAVKVIKNGNPAVVSNSNNEEEPCKRFRGVTDVGERAEDVGDVSGRLGIVRKPSKRFVDPSGDAHCAKGLLLQYDVLTMLYYFNWNYFFDFFRTFTRK